VSPVVATFVIRMWLPDRPGALGQVASRIGAVRGDVVGIDILERDGGQAVDELVVELPDGEHLELLVDEVRQVDGVAVEEVRPIADALHDPRLDALEAAAQLVGADDVEGLLSAVVVHARRVVGARWVAVVDIEDRGDGVLAADDAAPSAAWLEAYLAGSRAAEGVTRGRGRHASDVVWAPMANAGLALVLGREGMPYRSRERSQVAALARVVDTRLRELHRARSRARHPSR
jgi:ACT domain